MLKEVMRRLYGAAVFMVLVVLGGTAAYRALGGGRWSWTDCLYHTVITVATVGYGDLPGIAEVAYARALSMALIVTGTGAVVYFASNVTALVVEGDLRGMLRRRRMRREIDALKNHIIVCGIGRTGLHVMDEFRATRTPCVVIDADEHRLAGLFEERPDMLYIVGDATEDDTLTDAGITRARGIVAALPDDKDNLYITLTARSLNPALRILAKGVEPSAEPKLRKAGADKVISPNLIGGLRLASEMIRPNVTEFLDIMLRDPTHVLRIEEATVTPASPVVGRTLREAGLRAIADVLVVAVRAPSGRYTFNPGAEQMLEPGLVLIVLGEMREIQKLRAAMA